VRSVKGFEPRQILAASHRERFGDRIEPVTHHRKQRSAGRSEGQRARAAAEEGTAERCLDQADLMADCSWRQSQLVRGRFETHVARSRLKGAQRFERGQFSHGRPL
jgi:hypothetical protein